MLSIKKKILTLGKSLEVVFGREKKKSEAPDHDFDRTPQQQKNFWANCKNVYL